MGATWGTALLPPSNGRGALIQTNKKAAITAQTAAWRTTANCLNSANASARKLGRPVTATQLAQTFRVAYGQLITHVRDVQGLESEGARHHWLAALRDAYIHAANGAPEDHNSLSRLTARALQHAQSIDRTLVKRAKEEFRSWLAGGATYRSKYLSLLPGRNAYRFLRNENGWSPPAKGDGAMNWLQRTDAGHDELEEEGHEEHSSTCTPSSDMQALLNEQAEVEQAAEKWALHHFVEPATERRRVFLLVPPMVAHGKAGACR